MRVSRLISPWLVFAAAITAGPPAGAQILGGTTGDTTSLLPLPPPPLTVVMNKLDPQMQVRASQLSGRSTAIVAATSAAALPDVILLIQQTGGTVGRALPIVDGVVANIPHTSLAILTNSTVVRRIALDRLAAAAMERTGMTIGATVARQEFGYDGAGVGVAVIDSGVTAWHDDLSSVSAPGTQRIVQFVDLVNGSSMPYDDHGHGTHVAGIIAGNGFDSSGARAGIAPGAHLVVLKALDGAGQGRISNVISGLDYVLQHRNELGIRIVNLSVGAMVYESSNSDLLTVAARRVVEAGIVVVAAAGNAGRDNDGHTRYGSIVAPGNAPWVLTVGASSHMGTVDRGDDTVAAFSSRGPTAYDFNAKPDLLAPGVGIESLSAPGSLLYSSRPRYLLNGTVETGYLPYLSLTGTSQSAPVIAGTVALMLQANPALTPNAVKAILQYTAQADTRYDALTQGAGFVNARGAIELTRSLASSSTTPWPIANEWNGFLIWGNQRIHDGLLTAAATGWHPDVTWGGVTTPGGQNVGWGTICSGATCESPDSWTSWQTSCADPTCQVVTWGSGRSENVVWGTNCGGSNCSYTNFTDASHWIVTSASDGDTVVWGTGTDLDGDTVVWGTFDDGDTVVWGTMGDGDTVVWGTSGGDGVMWDDSCEQPDLRPVL